MSARDEYRNAYRAVRMLDKQARIDTTGMDHAMIRKAYQSRSASWRQDVTLRLHTAGQHYSRPQAQQIVRCFYRAGF